MKTRKRPFAKMVAVVLALAMMMSNVVLAEGESIVEDVVVNTEVIPAGQYPTTVKVTVTDAAKVENLKAEDFTVKGQASAWLTSKLHDFEATISEVALDGNVLTLTFGEFPEKYVYVDNYTVSGGDLTFTVTKETKTITPVADEFEQIREEASGGMDYNLYTPEDTSKPQPIVIVFHGYGDNENLYHNKLAVAWADPANQAERPCYVLAPSVTSFMDTDYRKGMYEKVFAEVQEMVDAGKVDPDRIYVVGKSFGGAAVYEFLETYPNDVAGAIAMCGAANYYNGYLFPQGEEDVAKIVDIPLWIAHATTDPTVGIDSSRNMHKMITEAGGKVVKFTEYSDEEMTAAGVTPEMSNHSMEAVVLEDETYLEWLFAQNNSIVEDVVVNTEVIPAGQYPTTVEVKVTDVAKVENLKAEDFTVKGQASAWLTSKLHDFEATIKDVALDGDVLTLTFGDFPEKYVYVDNYTVSGGDLTFKVTKETKTITPIADEFEQIREEANGGMDYNLFTPEDTSKPQPIVIAFHGYGDNENLYHNKLAVAWADPANQAERPCYVLAPSFSNFMNTGYRTGLYEKVFAEVQEMVEAGKVDPNRIYVVGKSFGGAAVYEFLEAYPDDVAGAIAMCGAANYYGGYLFPQKAEDAAKIADIPLWIAHATTDPTVGIDSSRNMHKMITEAGSTVVKFTEYSDEEMTAAGVTPEMSNHSMEAVVLEDETYLEWLFAQNNSAVEDVVVNTTVTTTGQYPTTIEVTVSDASLLEGLEASDFTVEGTALGWWVFTPNPFEAKVSDVSVKDNVLTLSISDFTNKYFYVQTMEVKCAKDAKLNFTKDDVSKVVTPVADEFTQVRAAEGGAFDYNLYTPEDTSKAQPLVISFHGFLDDDNLYQNRLAVSWAFEENQAERPCYVIAPMMGGFSYADGEYRTAIYEKLNAEVQKMIEAGQVDPERIYVVGKSFGGAAVYEYCAKYSDEIAAAIAMCGAADSFKISEEQIAKLVDVPLWIAHATDDNTVNVENSRNIYNGIVAAGGKLVKFTEYSEAEMNAAGVTKEMGYHTMEAVVLEDETYHEWLFSHPVVEELPGEGDDGNTGDDVISGDDADKDNDKADKDTAVKTGDTAPVVQLTMIAALSMFLAAVIAFRKRVNK